MKNSFTPDLISIVLGTRQRPDSMDRFVKAVFETAKRPELVEVSFYIDDDDMASIAKATSLSDYYKVHHIVGKRIVMSDMPNKAAEKCNGEIYMWAGDDVVMKTKGWDQVVRTTFAQVPDKILFAYGCDGHHKPNFGTHGFLHRNWIDTIGYIIPPYFVSDYADTWINHVSDIIGRKKYLSIMCEHLSVAFGKAEWDNNTRERIQRHHVANVDKLYNIDTLHLRLEDAQKLKQFIADQGNQLPLLELEPYSHQYFRNAET